MTSQINLGNISKELYYFNGILGIPKTFTGICKLNPGLLSLDENDIYVIKDGQVHCEDGPAVYFNNGSRKWYLYGKLHRENGPAIEYVDGRKEWYLNGKLHRLDGPAIDDGNKFWYFNGERHNTNGPAIQRPNGNKEWWINDQLHGTNDEFNNESWIHFQKSLIF